MLFGSVTVMCARTPPTAALRMHAAGIGARWRPGTHVTWIEEAAMPRIKQLWIPVLFFAVGTWISHGLAMGQSTDADSQAAEPQGKTSPADAGQNTSKEAPPAATSGPSQSPAASTPAAEGGGNASGGSSNILNTLFPRAGGTVEQSDYKAYTLGEVVVSESLKDSGYAISNEVTAEDIKATDSKTPADA